MAVPLFSGCGRVPVTSVRRLAAQVGKAVFGNADDVITRHADDVASQLPDDALRAARRSLSQQSAKALQTSAIHRRAYASFAQAATSSERVEGILQRITNSVKDKWDSLSPETKVRIKLAVKRLNEYRKHYQRLQKMAENQKLSEREAEKLEAESDRLAADMKRVEESLTPIAKATPDEIQMRYRNYRLRPNR